MVAYARRRVIRNSVKFLFEDTCVQVSLGNATTTTVGGKRQKASKDERQPVKTVELSTMTYCVWSLYVRVHIHYDMC